MGKAGEPQPILHFEDGFVAVKTLRVWTWQTRSPNCNSSAASADRESSLPPPYPIVPLVFVRNRGAIEHDDAISVAADSSYSSLDSYLSPKQVHSALDTAYPEFKLPSMKICPSRVKVQKHKGFSNTVFGCFTCCGRRQTKDADENEAGIPGQASEAPTWASHRVDDVTTLHVLQGDKETYIGTAHAIRYMRRRNHY